LSNWKNKVTEIYFIGSLLKSLSNKNASRFQKESVYL
jgi:hypothetical protein